MPSAVSGSAHVPWSLPPISLGVTRKLAQGTGKKLKSFPQSSPFPGASCRWGRCYLGVGARCPPEGQCFSKCGPRQCLHHLGNCWKCRISDPFLLTCQARNSGMGLTRVPVCFSLCSSQALSGSENQHFKGLGDQTSEKCLLVVGYWLVLDSGVCPLQQTPSTQVGPEAMLQLNDHLEAVTVQRAHRQPIH